MIEMTEILCKNWKVVTHVCCQFCAATTERAEMESRVSGSIQASPLDEEGKNTGKANKIKTKMKNKIK